MDTAQWPQEIVVKPIEEIVTNTCPIKPAAGLERKTRSHQKEAALNCPRCNSTNTKFCYYNNYSLTQPRYFCKTCRRYWTEGGSLRNIPVGGGSRKNKRSSSSSSSKKLPDLVAPPSLTQNPNDGGQDLNLAFPSASHQGYRSSISELVNQVIPSSVEINDKNSNNNQIIPSSSSSPKTSQLSAMELITGISNSRGLNNSFIPDPNNTVYNTSGFPMPTLNFSLDGLGIGVGSGYGVQETTGRLLFPFEDLKQVSTTATHHIDQQNKEQGDSTGYWTGMLGGGSW